VLFNESGNLATKEDIASRVALVCLALFAVLMAAITKLLKKVKISADMNKLVKSLVEPHGLEIYKTNIRKNMDSSYIRLEGSISEANKDLKSVNE
jgi:hypothetical protein